MTEDVEVAQKLNLNRLVQATVDAIHAARTPYQAAVAVCRLYTVLEPIRELEPDFEERWNEVLNGRFVAYTSSRRGATRIRWHHVWLAEACLLGVMERHGMGFQATLPDQAEADYSALLSELAQPDSKETSQPKKPGGEQHE